MTREELYDEVLNHPNTISFVKGYMQHRGWDVENKKIVKTISGWLCSKFVKAFYEKSKDWTENDEVWASAEIRQFIEETIKEMDEGINLIESPNFSFIAFTCGEAKEEKVSNLTLSEDLRQMSDEFWEETKNHN